MKDFLGNELNIGDTVVMIMPGYRSLVKSTILRFTKCYVILDLRNFPYVYNDEIKQFPDQMIKIV